MLRPTSSLLALAAAAAGCLAQPLPIPPVQFGDAGGPIYADTVIDFSTASGLADCTSYLQPCGVDGGEALGPCGQNAALGPPDGLGFPLDPGGQIQLAFRCDQTAAAQTLEVYGTGDSDAGASAVISVSEDGIDFEVVGLFPNPPTATETAYDLTDLDLATPTFVLITNSSDGGISIDAIEALSSIPDGGVQ